MDAEEIRQTVSEGYAKIAEDKGCGCGCGCGCGTPVDKTSLKIGYQQEEIDSVPAGADLGLGCGNPLAFSEIKPGETVLDLGSGAGFDCFLASRRVGEIGLVIGVDMTPAMLAKARENARKGGYSNVEFRLGEIEHLPLADQSVDLIISNCVINLSPDKPRVFREMYRVLKPGGRFMVSDVVLLGKLPDFILDSVAGLVGCFSGAVSRENYLEELAKAGFRGVKIIQETSFPMDCMLNDPTAQKIIAELKITAEALKEIEALVLSVKVAGEK